jgi:hypothetical protein
MEGCCREEGCTRVVGGEGEEVNVTPANSHDRRGKQMDSTRVGVANRFGRGRSAFSIYDRVISCILSVGGKTLYAVLFFMVLSDLVSDARNILKLQQLIDLVPFICGGV